MDTRERHVAYDYSHIAAHIAMVLAIVIATAFLLWLALAPVKATAFDADGVRCYSRAFSMECLKTANPGD
jgi:hypothetical protein